MSRSLRTLFLPLAAIALALSGCDDPTEIDAHAEAEGLAIVAGATELYRYMLEDDVTPTLTLPVGAYDVAIVLLDHDGDPLVHEGGQEEEEELSVVVLDESVLTWTPEAEVPGQAHEAEEFHGELEALAVGSTTMEVCLLHAGHCDFEVDVPVTVTP